MRNLFNHSLEATIIVLLACSVVVVVKITIAFLLCPINP